MAFKISFARKRISLTSKAFNEMARYMIIAGREAERDEIIEHLEAMQENLESSRDEADEKVYELIHDLLGILYSRGVK